MRGGLTYSKMFVTVGWVDPSPTYVVRQWHWPEEPTVLIAPCHHCRVRCADCVDSDPQLFCLCHWPLGTGLAEVVIGVGRFVFRPESETESRYEGSRFVCLFLCFNLPFG